MHKLLKHLIKVAFFSLLFAFSSCTNIKKAIAPINYDSSSTVLYEVSLAEKLLNSKPLDALAKAVVLKEKTSGYVEVEVLYKKAKSLVLQNFDKAVSSRNWKDAMLYFSSLSNIGQKIEMWSETSIKQKQISDWKRKGDLVLVESQSEPILDYIEKRPSSEIIERMIKGTVTVWVDRGMSIKNGVAFADRVIGSAFFIDERGYLLTNYHIIQSEVDSEYEGYSRVYIKDPNNVAIKVPAKVVGWDSILDVAILKTELTPDVTFKLGSSSDLKVGSKVYAIGSPAGLEKTLTSGIVSAKNRKLLSLGSVLQIDAAINHGNSGGPLIDENGNVQAIVFAGLEQNEGLNFAIPIEHVKKILPDLFAGGQLEHSWFGCYGHSLLPAENEYAKTGVVVDYILPRSPAYFASISEGDIIQKINGLTVKNLDDLHDLIFGMQVKTILRVEGLTYKNNFYQNETWYVQLEARPQFPGKAAYENDTISRVMFPLTGMKLKHISHNSYRISETIKGTPADEIGFSKNDYVELKGEHLDKEKSILFIQIYAKRRKSGYLEGFLGLYSYLDNPNYF